MLEGWGLPSLSPERLTGLYAGRPLGAGGALVEIAGRDSVGAAVALARKGRLRRVLPTIAYTGTEYGEAGVIFSNVERLRCLLEPLEVEVLEPVVSGSPLWWGAVIGRVNSILSRRYGPWHICVGCHMYLHAVRVPLAREAGTKRVVAGERLFHAGKIKINQTRQAVDAYRRALEEGGVELETPLLEVDDEEAILALAGDWEEGERQLRCVLEGNYRDLRARPVFEEEKMRAYLEEYLVPVTGRILASLGGKGRADYGALVEEVLR